MVWWDEIVLDRELIDVHLGGCWVCVLFQTELWGSGASKRQNELFLSILTWIWEFGVAGSRWYGLLRMHPTRKLVDSLSGLLRESERFVGDKPIDIPRNWIHEIKVKALNKWWAGACKQKDWKEMPKQKQPLGARIKGRELVVMKSNQCY